jgi:hypothetical protein
VTVALNVAQVKAFLAVWGRRSRQGAVGCGTVRVFPSGVSLMDLHFPVFVPVRGSDEFPLVGDGAEVTDCLPIFTSRELAEMYVEQADGGLQLFVLPDRAALTRHVQAMIRAAGVTHFVINFTFSPTSVRVGDVADLLEE